MRRMGGDFGGLSGLSLHNGVGMSQEKFSSAGTGRLATTGLADKCRCRAGEWVLPTLILSRCLRELGITGKFLEHPNPTPKHKSRKSLKARKIPGWERDSISLGPFLF